MVSPWNRGLKDAAWPEPSTAGRTLERRKFRADEIVPIFGVPVDAVNELERVTFVAGGKRADGPR